ncbi:hypothetical protein C8R47DRAFT_1159325 [Mycena vitilis]|nr:hypothetical protein C8R47DRAFT_1159325 [Mycena vitilis]
MEWNTLPPNTRLFRRGMSFRTLRASCPMSPRRHTHSPRSPCFPSFFALSLPFPCPFLALPCIILLQSHPTRCTSSSSLPSSPSPSLSVSQSPTLPRASSSELVLWAIAVFFDCVSFIRRWGFDCVSFVFALHGHRGPSKGTRLEDEFSLKPRRRSGDRDRLTSLLELIGVRACLRDALLGRGTRPD